MFSDLWVGCGSIWPELQGPVREVWTGLLCCGVGRVKSSYTNIVRVREHEVSVSVSHGMASCLGFSSRLALQFFVWHCGCSWLVAKRCDTFLDTSEWDVQGSIPFCRAC